MSARYARQIVLSEIGEAGQARIAAAHAVVPLSGVAGDVCARYLEAAGFAEVRVDSNATRPSLPFEVRDDAARAVAEGAFVALAEIRKALACR